MSTTTMGRRLPRAGAATSPVVRGKSKATVHIFLTIGCLYAVLPLLWLILAAAKSNAGILSGDLFSFRELDPAANLSALAHTDGGIYFRWYANSIGYAVFGAGTTGLICVAAGYAFEKYHFRGKEKLYGLVLLGILIPGTATTLPLYLLASKVHLVNTVWAVLLPYMVNPFGVLLGRVYAAAYVSDEMIEAARMDGAGELRIFRSIALPVLWPGFATIALFQFSGVWNSFYLPYLMLNNEKLFPVNLGLYEWNFTAASENPQMTAMVLTGSVLAIAPVIAVFIALQRFWRSGITAGSIK